VPARRILQLLARWSGIDDWQAVTSPADVLPRFHLERLPREPIVFGPQDQAFLNSGAHDP
jgi:hypothetical protein